MALSDDQKAMLRLLAQREQGYADIAALMGIGVDDVRAKVGDALLALDEGPSQDQRAMLRLLAQREDGYADIGALTGLGVEDVRAKVKGALAELDGPASEAAAEQPTPPLPPPSPQPAPPPAPPVEPATPPPPPPKQPAPKSFRPKAPKPGLPKDEGARRALIAGGAVVLVIVLLLVTGVFGGGDGGGSGTTTAASETTGGATGGGQATANGKQPTEATLKAVDGSGASGQALFGRSGQAVVLLLSAKGLQPSPAGQSYTVSLVRSSNERLPLVATKVGKEGVIGGRFQVAPQVLGLLAGGFDEMEVSIVPDSALKVALAQARKSQKAPDYGGTPILRGPVTGPIVEAGEG